MQKYFEPLLDKAIVRRYNQGATILYQGEVPRYACILMRGVVRVLNISSQGEEQIIMYHVAGEFFPSSWLFDKSPSTLFFYEALTDCALAFVPKQTFVDHMTGNPERFHALLDYYTTNYAASMIHINALEQPKAQGKLVYTLYYLCQRYGKAENGTVTIPLALTHKNLASMVGLTRETAAAEMNKLKRQGVLTYDKQKYVINLTKIMEVIGEETLQNARIGSQ